MKLNLVYNDFGDWQALYFNDELVYENHNIPHNVLAKYNSKLIESHSEYTLAEYSVINEIYEDTPMPKKFSEFEEDDIEEVEILRQNKCVI